MKFFIMYLIITGLFLTFMYGAGQCNELHDRMFREAEAKLKMEKEEEENSEED